MCSLVGGHCDLRKTARCDQAATGTFADSQARDDSHRLTFERCALQLVGADAPNGGVTMIAVLSPGVPGAPGVPGEPGVPGMPVAPVDPVGPAGPGTTTGAGGTFTTAAGLSQAAKPDTASTDMRIDRIMEAPFGCRRRGRKQVTHLGHQPTEQPARTTDSPAFALFLVFGNVPPDNACSLPTSRAVVSSLNGKFIDAKHEPRQAWVNFASCAAYIRRKGPQRNVGKDRRISG